MPARKRTKYPISSFGPELMALLIKGSREKVVLAFAGEGGRQKAKLLQLRVQTLRQRMREEEHPDYQIVTRAKVSVMWGERAVLNNAPPDWKEDELGNNGALLVVRPHDSEYTDLIKGAGVHVDQPPPDTREMPSDRDLLSEILQGMEPSVPPSEKKP